MTCLGKQTGFSLVPALFLLVVLAALGAVAVRLSAVEHQTVVLALQSSRAYAAAQAGVEWSAYQALVNGSCGNSSIALTEGGLSGFTCRHELQQHDALGRFGNDERLRTGGVRLQRTLWLARLCFPANSEHGDRCDVTI